MDWSNFSFWSLMPALMAACLVMAVVETEAKKRKAEAGEIQRRLDEILSRLGPRP